MASLSVRISGWLKDVDQETLHRRALKFMRKTRGGKEPSVEEIERAIRGKTFTAIAIT